MSSCVSVFSCGMNLYLVLCLLWLWCAQVLRFWGIREDSCGFRDGRVAGNLISDVTLLLKAGSANAVAMLQSTSQGVWFSLFQPHLPSPQESSCSWSHFDETVCDCIWLCLSFGKYFADISWAISVHSKNLTIRIDVHPSGRLLKWSSFKQVRRFKLWQ